MVLQNWIQVVHWVVHVCAQALSVQRCPAPASDAPPESGVETCRVTQAGGTLEWGSPAGPRFQQDQRRSCSRLLRAVVQAWGSSTTARTGKGCFFGAGRAFFEGGSMWKHWVRIKARSSLTHPLRARPPIFLALSKNAWKSPTPDFAAAVINTLRNLERSCSLIPNGLLEHILQYTNV